MKGWEPPKTKNALSVNFRLQQLEAAKAWGLTPKQWDQFPPKEKAEMMVFCEVEQKIESWFCHHPPEQPKSR